MPKGFLARFKAAAAESTNMTIVGAVSVAETSRLWDRTAELVSDAIGLTRNHLPESISVPALQQKSRNLVHKAEQLAQRLSDRAENRLRRAESKRKWEGQEQREICALKSRYAYLVESDGDDWGDEGWPDRREDVIALHEWAQGEYDEPGMTSGEVDGEGFCVECLKREDSAVLQGTDDVDVVEENDGEHEEDRLRVEQGGEVKEKG